MRVLLSTFGDGDLDKTLLAMRKLPYDTLMLVGRANADEPREVEALRRLESMTGNEVLFERLESEDFMGLVEEVTDLISRLSVPRGGRDDLVMNISGGTKLVADAALFAAFRMGIPTYHITERVVRLPVMKGVTARNRFTPLQAEFIAALGEEKTIGEMGSELESHSKQSLERIMRELRGMGLVSARLEDGQVSVSLTPYGEEVRKALALSKG